ncbi:MAG: PBP1A family penicillin-binding protein [Elusimicrobia bacterium]|nr:PBP1A family penicillin-binding protein [Elusimicrobiota bacterium]MDE2509989.1 PBP1A family penicillin-binding protein [Elusimicrobiota bacterium]
MRRSGFATLALAGLAALCVAALAASALAVMILAGWWRYHDNEHKIVEKMDQYYLNLTVPGREEYLLESDEVFEVPYMASKLAVAATPTRILDSKDRLIAEFSVEKGQYVRSPDDLPAYLKKALVASEDAHFYSHHGVDWKATARAVAVTLLKVRRQQGGSTLTQQLAKQMFTTRKKTIGRKIFEYFCARKLEEKYTKDQILLMYLNFAYFGHACFGVESAARYYFGKPASALDVGEAAMLVGIIPNPKRYSPLDNPELAKARLRTVLKRMVRNGYIPDSGVDRIERDFWDSFRRRLKTPEISFWRTRVNEAPYVVEFVRRQMLKSLTKERLLRGGLTIRTTFDLDAQKAAQDALAEGLAKENAPDAQADEDGEPAGKDEPVEGALAALRPADGSLSALVGGSGFSFQNQLDRASDGRRLMGSSVKPYVYAVAFQSGKATPETHYQDAPISFPVAGGKRWSPRNYGNKYFGDVRLDFALWKSLNSVAIRLLRDVDIDAVRRALALATGIPLDRWPRNLTLALGTADVAPVQMAQAFAVFANGGHAVRPWWLRGVEDRDGKLLIPGQAPTEPGPVVFTSTTCRTMTEVMRGVLGPEGSAGRQAKRLGFNIPAAGKSGTTNDYRDAWFSGFTPDLAVAVWIGHDDGVPMSPGKAGGAISAPVWMKFLKTVYLSRPTKDF